MHCDHHSWVLTHEALLDELIDEIVAFNWCVEAARQLRIEHFNDLISAHIASDSHL
jgi:hypothetical protein